jgi:hypothetical protein
VDLANLARVLWRFRLVVGLGFAIAVALSAMSLLRVDLGSVPPTVGYRANETWGSYARLLVTLPGFEWGRATPGLSGSPRGNAGAQAQQTRIDELRNAEARLSTLALFYAKLIDSDDVRSLMRRDGPIKGVVEATPQPAVEGSDAVLPIINVVGLAATRRGSLELAGRAAEALRRYVEARQVAAGIPRADRVIVQQLERPGNLWLKEPRKKTIPIVVFLTVMIGTVALAFALENLRPVVVSAQPDELGPDELAAASARRAAAR